MDGSSPNPEESVAYRSYLLRVWQEGKVGDCWRASLQSAATGERQGFASLDGLFDFIRREATPASDTQPGLNVEEIGEQGGDEPVDRSLRMNPHGVFVNSEAMGAERSLNHEKANIVSLGHPDPGRRAVDCAGVGVS